jgi:DNA polymerase-1
MFDLAGISDYPITEKGNPSFNEDYLETNELGLKVLSVRKMTTLIDRFIGPLRDTHLIQGRVSPHYNQLFQGDFGTITGRLSCDNPNIQQVYKRDKKLGKIFRKIFIPDEGMTWSSNDYKSCEPRIYSHYSGSALLRDGFLATPTVDFYQTLSNITGIPRSPTAGVAGNCKQLALSIFYGAGIPRTAEMLGVSIQRAKEIRAMVNDMCPEIGHFAREATARAKNRGYVRTVLGRRCRFTSGGEFRAGGYVVAGGNADLLKSALVEVDDYLISMDCPPPLATVHDSIECQFPIGRADINNEVIRIMEACGQSALINFSIPQEVENGTGDTWAFATYGED